MLNPDCNPDCNPVIEVARKIERQINTHILIDNSKNKVKKFLTARVHLFLHKYNTIKCLFKYRVYFHLFMTKTNKHFSLYDKGQQTLKP